MVSPFIPFKHVEAKSHILTQTPMTLGAQALRELNSSQTSTERGVQRWEQANSCKGQIGDGRPLCNAIHMCIIVYLVYRMQNCCVKIWVKPPVWFSWTPSAETAAGTSRFSPGCHQRIPALPSCTSFQLIGRGLRALEK